MVRQHFICEIGTPPPCAGDKCKQAQRKSNIFTPSQNSLVNCFQQSNMMFVCVRQTDSTKARSDKGHGNPLGIFFKCTESKAWGYKDRQSSREF